MEPNATGASRASHPIQQSLFDPAVGAGRPSGVQGALHGTRPILCETFVDPTQCDGACDKAANGQHIRATAGQGKTKPAKDITVTPFDPHFRAFLKGKKKPLSTRNRQKAKRTALREDPPFTALWSRMIDAATRMAHHHLDRHAFYLPSRPLRRTSWHDNRGG